jgi:foldase protein PrsA
MAKNNQSFLTRLGSLNLVTKLLVLVIILILLQYKYLLVPVVVNGEPIFSWEYVSKLHELGGPAVIDGMVRERLVEQAAKDKGIRITDEELQAEVDRWTAQLDATGGIDSWLTDQGMTREDFERQISLNLKIEKLVGDQIVVTDEEVQSEYETNAEFFVDVTEEAAKEQIKEGLIQEKLQRQANLIINDLQTAAEVKLFLPGIEAY